MDITQQDKRDIEETILWLEEGAEYLDMQKDIMDGVENWRENVVGSIDTAIMWLKMLVIYNQKTTKGEWDGRHKCNNNREIRTLEGKSGNPTAIRVWRVR
mgnify:CR=1 FL=1